ncbi:hypothetical protein [Virgibacillus phasianinus]|uniref:hypothetical protein n=1 Tax=Virgibacillus phasianinus TaxID=2017483 RepID=UPI0012FE49D8|nr:hypothetical protein [Virgibacillus phasianinus]
MTNKLKSFLSSIAGVLVGITVVSIIQNGEIDWGTIGTFLFLIFLILFFRLGLNLYKK